MRTKILMMFLLAALIGFAGCGDDFDEPASEVINANPDDTSVEKLPSRVEYYTGVGSEIKRIVFAYREAGTYCLIPMTEERDKELSALADAPSSTTSVNVMKAGDMYFISGGRDFITGDDYVSDRYFRGYHGTEPYFITILPTINIQYPNEEDRAYVEKKFGERLKLRKVSHEVYRYNTRLLHSTQVLELVNELYRSGHVLWAEAGMIAPVWRDNENSTME